MSKKEEKESPKVEIDPSILEDAEKAIKTKGGNVRDKEEISEVTNESSTPKEEVDYKDRFIRLSADFDNYRKRILKEKTDYIKYGNESLLKEILPILDNFERALHASSESDASSILKGVEMIFTQLTQSLGQFGLKSEQTHGQPFNPNLHEAVSHVQDDTVAPHTIIEEHQKMYRYHDKLLRPALVTVSKAVEESSDQSDQED